MTKEAIAARLRAAEPRIAWDWRGSACGAEARVLDTVSAEVERIVSERLTDACLAEVERLNARADEREACARIAEEHADTWHAAGHECADIAAKIRARGKRT